MKARRHPIDRLFSLIKSRKGRDANKSYTAELLKAGVERCARKFGEESLEAALAAVAGNEKEIAAESADVLYHLLVLWAACGIAPKDVYTVLAAREGRSGHEEKASRKR